MADLVVPFGENATGRLVLVDDVARGLACECVCPGCRKPLVARNGKDIVVVHHFAHAAAEGGCGGAPETSLHRYAKQVLADGRRVLLPPLIAVYRQHRNVLAVAMDFQAERVDIERRVGNFQPDAIMVAEGQEIAVEVHVTHRVDAEKIQKIRAAEMPAIEIDLTYTNRDFDPTEVAERVRSKAFRSWLYHPRLGPESEALRERVERAAARHRAAAEKARQDAERARTDAAAAAQQYWADVHAERRRQLAKPAAVEPAEHPAWNELPRPRPPLQPRPWGPAELAGLRRAALMRPSSWPGATAYPMPGAFCGRCESTAGFRRDGDIWRCTTCFPEVAHAG